MQFVKIFFCCFLFACFPTLVKAQQIVGIVQDRAETSPLRGVQLLNVHSNTQVFTDSLGGFAIAAKKGELIEIRYPGYRKESFRISQGNVPPFFKIYLSKASVLNTDKYASSGYTQYQIDSIKSRELFSAALNFPKMSTLDMIESPFSAMSKSNRQKWAFQESFALFEQEKFIDFSFNEQLVKQITGLEGEELERYMRFYRPSYQALRNMSQYDYYQYIRQSAERFIKLRSSTPRNSG